MPGVRVDGPVEEYAQVDISVYLAAHQLVPRVVVRVVPLPAKGRAEIPLIVQREPRGERGDARGLEDVDRDRIAQLGGVEEGVVSHADALHRVRIEPPPIAVGRKAEAVLQVAGEVGADGAVSLVVAPQESTGGEDIGRTELRAEHVGDAGTGGAVGRLGGLRKGRKAQGQQQEQGARVILHRCGSSRFGYRNSHRDGRWSACR